MTKQESPLPVDSRISTGRQIAGFVVCVLVCFAAAGVGGLVTTPEIPNWYAQLAKPSWTPPDWLFGPVWTLLYLMMAVSAWLVWRTGGYPPNRGPLRLFAVQLLLNSLWSILFFGCHRPGLAAVEIVVLWSLILATTLVFGRRVPWAGLLLIPYLMWVSFAALLNVTIWWLNF